MERGKEKPPGGSRGPAEAGSRGDRLDKGRSPGGPVSAVYSPTAALAARRSSLKQTDSQAGDVRTQNRLVRSTGRRL